MEGSKSIELCPIFLHPSRHLRVGTKCEIRRKARENMPRIRCEICSKLTVNTPERHH